MHKYPSPHVPPPAVDPLDRTRFPVNEWALVEEQYSAEDLGVTETLFAVGNGYLGMRGTPEEGRDTHTHGTYINGFHETWRIEHAEDAFGLARVGQTIVNVPDAKVMKIYIDDEPLLLSMADLEEYSRVLSFADGVLTRQLLWRTPSGKRVRILSRRMVSFAERHVAVMTLSLELLNGDAPVVISSQILNRQDGKDEYHVKSAAMGEGGDPRKAESFDRRVLDPQFKQVEKDSLLLLGFRTAESKMTIAVGAQHLMETENNYKIFSEAEDDSAKVVYRIDAKQGVPIDLAKVAVYHTSRGVPVTELVDRCRRTVERIVRDGVDHAFSQQRELLDRFWDRSDVVVEGQPEVQQAVRWNLFQLAQAAIRAEGQGIPAKGMTGSGYGGHYFWDTEVYALPFFTYTTPRVARNALRFRYTMLDAARKRAAELAQVGALYPWRTINGEEASAFFAAGTAQYHIDADISYALMKYYLATGDRDFMLREGIDILVETARLWEDLGFWRSNGDHSFHIHGVTGPDEYTTVVNDNLFTNVMAMFNLSAAAQVLTDIAETDPEAFERISRRLQIGDDEIERWRSAAAAMFVPFDAELGVHPQDIHFVEREVWDLDNTPDSVRPLLLYFHPLVIYRFQVLKQADVVLAMYLRGDYFTAEEKRANFEYYDPITTGDSTLSAVVQSIVAAEVGYDELALRYFYAGLFVDLDDRHGNASDGVHVASAGGIWSCLTAGFGGLRDYTGELSFDPRLPDSWQALSFKLRWHDSRIHVRVEAKTISFTLLEGDPVQVMVRGAEYTVTAEEPVRVELPDQGRRIGGSVGSLPQVAGHREDGSTITSTVPRIDIE
ncbi:glycoside hydrolase family 65 protein [Naumannella halotolerans]|uniref:Alpha,alpha-trehalose phosphorylase n=1 Tax=Naumannella halotolerans TaxID=993414 RepID=A0A4R7IZ00_9ACTN|nr:glycosyl hydrolase family 65 protein [Naumannella halotolerans]TDT30022.1 alpha,alpha-trehalose phosphorylase [Naumannella halotolerans]